MQLNVRSHPVRLLVLTLIVTAILLVVLMPLFTFLLMLDGVTIHDAEFFVHNPNMLLAFTFWAAILALFAITLAAVVLKALIFRRRHGRRARAEAEPPAFDQLQAQIWTSELIPFVEAAAGRQFSAHPKVELVEWRQLGRALAQDALLPQHKRKRGRGDLVGRLMELTAIEAAMPLTPYVIGKYGFSSKTVYLLPRNTSAVLKLAGLSAQDTEAVVKLTIAHELVHVLQDEAVGLEQQFHEAGDWERRQTFNVVMEGQAMVVQELIATRLDATSTLSALNRLVLGGEDSDEAAQRPTSMAGIYRLGEAYMKKHFQHGGCDRLWQVLANPPSAMRELT